MISPYQIACPMLWFICAFVFYLGVLFKKTKEQKPKEFFSIYEDTFENIPICAAQWPCRIICATRAREKHSWRTGIFLLFKQYALYNWAGLPSCLNCLIWWSLMFICFPPTITMWFQIPVLIFLFHVIISVAGIHITKCLKSFLEGK